MGYNIRERVVRNSSDSQTKTKVATTSDKKKFLAPAPQQIQNIRKLGVFPNGVQPYRVVLVIDDTVPFVDIAKLKQSIYSVISYTNQDALGILTLIKQHKLFLKDNTLFVLQPGLDFFLKNMSAVFLEEDHSPSTEKANNKSISSQLNILMSIAKEFSIEMKEIYHNIISELTAKHEAAFKFGELTCASRTNSPAGCDSVTHEDLETCDSTPTETVQNDGKIHTSKLLLLVLLFIT